MALDALWMGVPVVSMSGRLAVSCCGRVSLGPLGLPVARTLDDYVALALEMVKMVLTQPKSRQFIRNAMSQSPLMDGEGALESAYRTLWRNWCSGQTGELALNLSAQPPPKKRHSSRT